jgi:hypothetical protein
VRRAIPYALFGAVTLTIFWPFLLKGRSLYAVGTVRAQFGKTDDPRPAAGALPEPSSDNILLLPVNLRIYNEGLKAGELRLWNPYLFCGYPVYADPMVHPFYPPQLALHFLFSPDTAFQLSLLLHLFFSGCAMYWLLRGLGRGQAGATAGGLAWMLFGYNAASFSSSILLGTNVFGPLALLAVVRGLEARDLTGAARAGLAMGMVILGSHPQYALHVFIFICAWLGVALARDPRRRTFTICFGAAFAVLAVGTGFAAVLTRLDTLAVGYRQPAADFGQYYREPWALVTHLAGLVLGKVYFPGDPFVALQFTCYAGLTVTTLAVTGAARGWKDPFIRFTAIFGAAALAAAFLKPVAWVFQHVPILNLSPSARWIFMAGFCIAVLAARGLEEIVREPRKVPLVAGLAALIAGALAVAASARATPETVAGFVLVAASAVALRRNPRFALGIGAAALGVELLPYFFHFNPHADTGVLRETPEAVRFVQEREKGEPWRGTGGLGSAYAALGKLNGQEFSHGNNVLSLFGVENPAGYEAIIPQHFVLFCHEAGGIVDPAGRAVFFTDFTSRLLPLTAMKYLFMPFALQPGPPFRRVREWGPLRLYENPEALPRAWLVTEVRTAMSPAQALDLIKAGDFNPRRAVVLEPAGPLSPPAPSAGPGSVRWIERSTDRLALEVTAPSDAVLVLSETDYPGWEAAIDGKEAAIHRANFAFRAVSVPAGAHRVEMRFRPEPVRTGLMGSLLCALLALGYGFLRRAWGAPLTAPA